MANDSKTKWIQNVHVSAVKCKLAGKTEVVFPISSVNKFDGRQQHTGYTEVLEEMYKKLLSESKLFVHFIKIKKLVVYDEAPPDALTSHQAVAEIRKEAAAAQAELASLKAENEKLQNALIEAQERIKVLSGEKTEDTNF